MSTDGFDNLKGLFDMFRDKHQQLRSQTATNVSKWLWTTGMFFSIIPFEQEREQTFKGKPLRGEPKSPKDVHAFGFDSTGRLWAMRRYNSIGVVDAESFSLHEQGKSLTFHFLCLPDAELGRVDELTYENGAPKQLMSRGRRGDTRIEVYEYSHSNLIRSIHVERHIRSRKLPLVVDYELSHDGSGGGQATLVDAAGKRKVSFEFETAESPAGKPLVETVLMDFEIELARAIHDIVRVYRTNDTVYCLALNYESDPGNGCIPTIGLGIAKENEMIPIPQREIPDSEEWRWNPAEFPTHGDSRLQVWTDKVKELDRKLRSYYVGGESIDIRAACNRIAIKLNQLDWSPLPVAQDFIVYAVDNDVVDLNENFALARASIARRSE
jgi:hypothetical protein